VLNVPLPPELENRVKGFAERLGVDPLDYARSLIERGLPPAGPDVATLRLIKQWDAEDETTDVNEISRRAREFEELKAAINETRAKTEGSNGRTIYP
jgi:hypothetical protein